MRHLLAHTSGVPRWNAFHELLTGVDYLAADELNALFQTKELLTPPGQAWSYSSPGDCLLGQIVQKAADQPYGELIGEIVAASA